MADLYSLYRMVTLKVTKFHQLFLPFQQCIFASLVKIHLLVRKITHGNEATRTLFAPKTKYRPHPCTHTDTHTRTHTHTHTHTHTPFDGEIKRRQTRKNVKRDHSRVFHAQNREPAEKNMSSHSRSDTEESTCEI